MMKRFGEKYWADLPWDGKLGNDDRFRLLEGDEVRDMAQEAIAEFDQIAIFVIFSVFESVVRRELADHLLPEISSLKHPALQKAASRMLKNIAKGSFYNNILELFKGDGEFPGGHEFTSQVDQVNRIRTYRNWVAHGRRVEDQPDPISPKDAYDNLQAFLTSMRRAS